MAQMQTSSKQQAKLAQLETQEISNLLTAPNSYGTNKLLINVNGQNSKIKTNKNGIVKYTLEQPVKLEIGDKVTLIDSFIEERGLSSDTVSFEEDVEEEMRFLYYNQGDLRNNKSTVGEDPFKGYCADMEFANFPSFYPDIWTGAGLDAAFNKYIDLASDTAGDPSYLATNVRNEHCFPSWNNLDKAQGTSQDGSNDNLSQVIQRFCTSGNNGQYYYMMEWFSPGGDKSWVPYEGVPIQGFAKKMFMRPLYGSATIKIPAGNYTVSALGQLINGQLNGNLKDPSNPNIDVMENRLFNKEDSAYFQQTIPAFDGLMKESFQPSGQSNTVYNPDALIIGEDTFQGFQRRRGDIITRFHFNGDMTANRVNVQIANATPNDFNLPDPLDTITWANNSSFRIGRDPLTSIGDPSNICLNTDPTYSSSNPLRAWNTNFYLHLDGFRKLMDGPDGQYFGASDSTDAEILDNFNPKKLPNCQSVFLCSLGPKGLYFFNNDVKEYNTEAYPDTPASAANNAIRKYWYGGGNCTSNIARNPDKNIEDFGFQCLFGVSGSGDGADPGNEAASIPTKGNPLQFAGTTAFELKYDSGTQNRFTIDNLHEPYKLPAALPSQDKTTGFGGQQATLYNQPVVFDFEPTNPAINRSVVTSCGVYPIDSVGGIAVNNFSFGTVKNTTVYKNLVANINKYNTDNTSNQMYREKLIYDLFTKPYDKFFTGETEAREAWSKTLWERLGFNYDQFGNVTKNLEDVHVFSQPKNPTKVVDTQFDNIRSQKQMGIITHNQFNTSFIVSSGGLGLSNPYGSLSATNQNYSMRAMNVAATNAATASGIGYLPNYIHLLSDSQPLVAQDFPSLNNGNNYLILESDIVKTNAKDSNATDVTIVGVVSKENSTNDTLFGVEPVEFTVTSPKLLATIEVRIKNPDGTLVSDDVVGKNNSFLFKIDKSIKPEEMTLENF